MSLTVEAVYKDGVLKPRKRLRLPDGSKVRVTITPLDEGEDPLDRFLGTCDGPPDGAENHDKYLYGDLRP
jgi:predicted DNA-binding antitoxin AbrB/MazE fold protein